MFKVSWQSPKSHVTHVSTERLRLYPPPPPPSKNNPAQSLPNSFRTESWVYTKFDTGPQQGYIPDKRGAGGSKRVSTLPIYPPIDFVCNTIVGKNLSTERLTLYPSPKEKKTAQSLPNSFRTFMKLLIV